MSTTLPSGQISFNDIQNAYGGSNPISLNEYYRGGSYVDNLGADSPNIPTSGAISANNFRGTTAWSLAYAQLGDTTSGLIYGSHYNSGGGFAGSLNYALYITGGTYGSNVAYASRFYIAPMGAGTYYSAGGNGIAQVGTSLASNWFPLIPTLYGSIDGTSNAGSLYRSVLALGTNDISATGHTPADTNTTFCWKHPRSNWSNTMITNMLGFNSTQLSKVQPAIRVWWDYMQSGMDSAVRTGFMILSASVYNSLGAQSCFNSVSKFYMTQVIDVGGEWSIQGFAYNPTVSPTSGPNISVTNTGPSTVVWNGSTYRASDVVMGVGGQTDGTNQGTDYTYTLGVDDLVIPMMWNDTGFSGAAWNSARNPLTAQFGMIEAY
jgi:hypothetical protein